MAKKEKRANRHLETFSRKDVALGRDRVGSNHKDQGVATKIREESNKDKGRDYLISKMIIDKEWPPNRASNSES